MMSALLLNAFRAGCVVAFSIALIVGCSRPVSPSIASLRVPADHTPIVFDSVDDSRSISFPVDWPPVDPSRRSSDRAPLLSGRLVVQSGILADRSSLGVRIELRRASSERDRARWNRDLKFPEYDWMSRVRTWDHSQEWLWPNLPFLLRVRGIERQQRYGGIDPGKGVDNDFAAVVLRPAAASRANVELVTAEWHPPRGRSVDKHTVIHNAISDDLIWSVPEATNRGTLNVWLIYADFLDYDPPTTWPEQGEFDGGILAFFTCQWSKLEDGSVSIVQCENTIPTASTGVQWQQWVNQSK